MNKLTATLLATAVATIAMPAFADTGMYAGLKGGKLLVKRDFVKDMAPNGIIDGQTNDVSYATAYAGYQVNQNIGVELEYGSTGTKDYDVSPTERILVDSKGQPVGKINTSDATTKEKVEYLGAYVTARYDVADTPMYVKARAGAAQVKYTNKAVYNEDRTVTVTKTSPDPDDPKKTVTTKEDVTTTNRYQAKRSKDKVSAAGGIALGVKPVKGSDKVAVELEYNYLNRDVQSVGIGAQYKF